MREAAGGLAPSRNGLVTNIVSLNIGVKIGQVLALATNTLLMAGGFVLVGYQITGYALG